MSLLVAVLSDTHMPSPSSVVGMPPRILPQRIFPYLEQVDLILHAGDIVEASVLDDLANYAPVHAVRGNWDVDPSVMNLPEVLELELGGVSVAMIHDAGRKEGRRNRMKKRLPKARVVVFGHSHKPGVEDEEGLMLLNPGMTLSTFALLYVREGDVQGEIVDLATGQHHSTGQYPPLSTKRPQDANFSAASKKSLMERAKFRCQICFSVEALHFHHVVPVSKGGGGTLENGQVLCRRCSVEKTSRERCWEELKRYLEKNPDRIIPNDWVDWAFNYHLSGLNTPLSVRKEEFYGLTLECLVAKLVLEDDEAVHLALDLVRVGITVRVTGRHQDARLE